MSAQELIRKIESNLSSYSLSGLLPEMCSIALKCKDYEGFCLFSLWGRSIFREKEVNINNNETEILTMINYGIDTEKAKAIQRNSFEKYISMRSISKDNVCVYSIREIEESIRRCDEMMDILSAPKELAPVDLYYENQAMRAQKLEALLNKRSMQDQYNIFYSFAFTKLNYYKTIDICVHSETDTDAHANNKKVFIIYGHNEAKRRELKELLQKLGLQPVVLPEQPDLGQTIIEKFEKCASDCSYAFAILTPDDNVVKEKYSYFQARPNVIFELGWFYSRLGRKRVCVLDQIRDNVNIFSDLQGIMRITFTKDINEKYIDITKELKSVGLIE